MDTEKIIKRILNLIKKKDPEKIIEKDLRFIKEKGDLYDVISQKRNATPDTILRKQIKAQALILSRILYLFLVCSRRTKNSFAPVKKVKQAQDEIREYIGLPIDIFKEKIMYFTDRYKPLGIMYGNYCADSNTKQTSPSIEDLERDLKKIADFCLKFSINDIYIDEFFLKTYLSVEFLGNFEHISHSEMLNHYDDEVLSFKNIKVNLKELNDIIVKLEENEYDNEYIYSFKNKISDQVIKDAIDTFKYDNDVDKLMRVVKSRLSLHINDEGIIKDRVYGKIYENYEIGGPYLKMSVSDSDGNFISENIISLYNYLETRDFSSLENRANIVTDNQEIDLISLLYLHLLGEEKKEEKSTEAINSIYDYIYNEYKTAKNNKKIPWIKTKLQKLEAEIIPFIFAFFSILFTFILSCLLKFPNYLPLNDSFLNRYNDILKKIESPYKKSYELEQNIVRRIKQTIEKFLPKKMSEEIINYAQEEMDLKSKAKNVKRVAEIEWFTEEKRPVYFMDHYFRYAHFRDGEVNFFWPCREIIGPYEVADCEPLFQIKTPISKSEFDSDRYYLPIELCPIGDDYILTQVIVKDEDDESKCIKLDAKWYEENMFGFPSKEREILQSMESPMIYYKYGIQKNKSLVSMDKREYTEEISEEEAKTAIKKGLGLSENATNEEINAKIASKGYTRYPLYKSMPLSQIDELEYYEKIASLDNIDINLAAVLTTLANDGFVYTVGYKNSNEDDYILTDEAYVWAMNDEGEIIDFLSNLANDESLSLKDEESSNLGNSNSWTTDEEKENNILNAILNDKENNNKENNNKENKDISLKEQNDEENKWNSEKEDNEIKEILDKIRLWAKKYHISYFIAAILAVLIIKKIFGRKIQLKLKLKQTYKILNEDNLANTYVELMNFIYGEESMPIERPIDEMIELIYKEFYAFNEEDIEDLLMELKSVIKENNNPESLKKVEELLSIIPFVKERKEELNLYFLKKETLNLKKEYLALKRKIK